MPVTFVQDGGKVEYTPGVDVTAGAVDVQNDLIGVTSRPIAANTLGAWRWKACSSFPRRPGRGGAISAGGSVYWDVAEQFAKADDESGAKQPDRQDRGGGRRG